MGRWNTFNYTRFIQECKSDQAQPGVLSRCFVQPEIHYRSLVDLWGTIDSERQWAG